VARLRCLEARVSAGGVERSERGFCSCPCHLAKTKIKNTKHKTNNNQSLKTKTTYKACHSFTLSLFPLHLFVTTYGLGYTLDGGPLKRGREWTCLARWRHRTGGDADGGCHTLRARWSGILLKPIDLFIHAPFGAMLCNRILYSARGPGRGCQSWYA